MWLIYHFMPCSLIIGLSNMKPFAKTALSSRVVSNVVKVTLTPLMMIRLWYIGPFHFSILFCEIIIIGTSTRCVSYPCQSTYTQHRDGSMQTRRASCTGSPNLSKDARGMAKRGKDWRKISIVRRRPGHPFLWPRTAYLHMKPSVSKKNERDRDPLTLWNIVYLQ